MDFSLTFVFFERQELVAVITNQLVIDDVVIEYIAAAYVQTHDDLTLQVSIKNKPKDTCAIAVACPVGQMQNIYPLSKDESPWSDYCANFINPEDYATYILAQRAWAYARDIIQQEPYLKEYVLTGDIQAAHHRDLSLAYDHQGAWPFDEVILFLKIIALTIEDLKCYLPNDIFPVFSYESDWPYQANNALFIIMQAAISAMQVALNWNDWINCNELINETIEKDFNSLYEQLNLIENQNIIEEIDWLYWSQALLPSQQLANSILTRLGWPADNRYPTRSAIQVLDEMTGGLYSEEVLQQKNV